MAAVRIRPAVLAALLQHARSQPEIECCGLLAGPRETITELLPARNALHSPTAFEIAPEELFALFRTLRASGLRLLGIYHSHPHGPNVPSPRDIERAYYPQAAYFVVSPRPDCRQPVRAFRIEGERVEELEIVCVEAD